jgi:radical SAM superfamily enzyme YgiQ (UPF0313 family)
MKVALINPAQLDSKYKFMGVVAPPLGLAYMAAVLEENDVEVIIIDACALEMDLGSVGRQLIEFSPDIIAITALTPTIAKALETAEYSKRVCKDSLIVMGGYHPTFNYNEILKYDFVDVVTIGEGEETLLDLTQTLEHDLPLSSVNGIAFDDVVTPPRQLIMDLDSLPLPARHLLPMDSYKLLNMDTKMSTMITSRGCPMQCSFCSSAALHGSKLRMRSVDKILDEMEYLVNEMGIETIAFMDDTFTISKKRVIELCEGIEERNIEVMWGCTSRVDSLNKELLRRMKRAGCITVFMGVESADQQMLDTVNKQTTIERIRDAFEVSRQEKIRTIASVVLGMPGDTHESIKNTINFVKELNPSYAIFSLATPYPGTKFYQQTLEKDLIKVKDWSKYTLISPILETVDCSLEELKNLQASAFKKFYLRPMYLIRQIIMDGPILIKTISGVMRNIMFPAKKNQDVPMKFQKRMVDLD